MAIGHSTPHARLMGANLRNAGSTSASPQTLPSTALEGFLFLPGGSFENPTAGASRHGRPGSRALAQLRARRKRGACRRERREQSRSTDGRANRIRVRFGGAILFRAPRQQFVFPFAALG